MSEMSKEQEVVYGKSYNPYARDSVSKYWKEKYDKDAEIYWNRFYKSNEDKFFKDRHYLEREFTELEQSKSSILEIGCGVGNSTLPLLEINPNLQFYSFDFSKKALDILIDRSKEQNIDNKVSVFYWDPVTQEYPSIYKYNDNNSIIPQENQCDYGLLIFVLSAIAPEKMKNVLLRVSRYIKPGGSILLRDYAENDMAHLRFMKKPKDSKLEDKFYVRGDGTRAYYFTEDFINQLANDCGIFSSVIISFIEKDVCNRELNITMPRRFIQVKFIKSHN